MSIDETLINRLKESNANNPTGLRYIRQQETMLEKLDTYNKKVTDEVMKNKGTIGLKQLAEMAYDTFMATKPSSTMANVQSDYNPERVKPVGSLGYNFDRRV